MNIAKGLIAFGSIVLGLGLFLYAYEYVPFFGKLKGDLLLERGNFKFYLPITSSIIISLLLTIFFNLFKR